jgi:phospholipid transport system substrate-binding protein
MEKSFRNESLSRNPDRGTVFRIGAVAFLSCALLVSTASPASPAGGPLDVVRDSNRRILELFAKQPHPDKKTEETVNRIMDSVTDFDRISTSATGKFCEKLGAEQCRQFNELFKKLLRVSSVKKLGRYRADRFDYQGEEITGNRAVVRTVAHYQEDAVQLDYHLELTGSGWKIVNYVADGVDTIRNYRKQFTKILERESFPALAARLEKKIKEYESENEDNTPPARPAR